MDDIDLEKARRKLRKATSRHIGRGKPTHKRAEDMRKAVEMRKAGASYEQIAKALGVNKNSAYETVRKAIRDTYREPAEELRTIEFERLQTLHAKFWVLAIDEQRDYSIRSSAADRCIRIIKEQRELFGLDDIELANRLVEQSVETLVRSFGPEHEAMLQAALALASSGDENELRLGRMIDKWSRNIKRERTNANKKVAAATKEDPSSPSEDNPDE